jgi:LPS-assembly lipoprotein
LFRNVTQKPNRPARRFGGIGLAVAAIGLAGCTAQPLYATPAPTGVPAGVMDKTAASAMSMQSVLSTVAIKPVGTRPAQMLRNRLIFLFGQGGGEPNAPAYMLALTVGITKEPVAAVQVTGTDFDQPSAQRLTMSADYVLTDASGTELARSTRSATANYDVPSQGFAERSAERDAEDRAARELGEMIHLAVAQTLSRS